MNNILELKKVPYDNILSKEEAQKIAARLIKDNFLDESKVEKALRFFAKLKVVLAASDFIMGTDKDWKLDVIDNEIVISNKGVDINLTKILRE